MNNPYAPEEQEQTAQRWHPSDVANASTAVGALMVFIIVLAAILGPMVYRDMQPDPPAKFHYGDRVVVVNGFHRGDSGAVVDATYWSHKSDWSYMMRLDRAGTKHVDEKDLVGEQR